MLDVQAVEHRASFTLVHSFDKELGGNTTSGAKLLYSCVGRPYVFATEKESVRATDDIARRDDSVVLGLLSFGDDLNKFFSFIVHNNLSIDLWFKQNKKRAGTSRPDPLFRNDT